MGLFINNNKRLLMGINNILKNALNTNWTWTDNFSFFFHNNKISFPSKTSLNPQDLWDICIINIDLPQVSSNVDTIVMGQKYRAWVPLHDVFTFTVTFRDVERMQLKEYFTEIWKNQQTEYFDDIKSTVKIEAGNGIMFESENVLITNVSQTQLDNTNTQIAEFSVEFMSTTYSNNSVKNFNGWAK